MRRDATAEHALPPSQAAVFVATDDPRWPALAERYRRDNPHAGGFSPPTSCKAGQGWYFPPDWLDALNPKRQRG